MNESEFKSKWETEKPIYEEWGEYVAAAISDELAKIGKDLAQFLKVPAVPRLKSDMSLIDKAFYRKKNYADPYSEIEDKVGVRFVVLLIEDIRTICQAVENIDIWTVDACKHFDEDREKEPLLFTYQSVHYVLRPKEQIESHGVKIPADTACELQIRTLLQHAHAELTHDAIYKSKRTVKPSVQRTVAKSMALIETTDEFFTSVTNELNYGPLKEFSILERLDALFLSFTGLQPHTQKSSLVIWDEFEQLIDDELVGKIGDELVSNPDYQFLRDPIVRRYSENTFYQQSTILFLYWMLIYRKRRLFRDWPLDSKILDPLASDLGTTTWEI